MWLDRDSLDGDSGVFIVIAAAVGVPAFLLGAVALVLLSGRTRSVKIINTATALAVLVALLPMGLIFLREVWAAFAFAFLFAVLVALVLTEPAEKDLPEAARQIQSSESPEPSEEAAELLPPTSLDDAAGAVPAIARRLPAPWKRRLSRGSRATIKRAGDAHRPKKRREKVRYVALRTGHITPPSGPSGAAANANDSLSPLQSPGRDSGTILEALLHRLESGLERFERSLAGSATGFDEAPPTPDERPAQSLTLDAAETFAEEWLAPLCERVETSTGRLERLITEADSRFKEWLAAARDGEPIMTPSEPDAAADATEALRSVREGIAGLLRALDGKEPASADLEVWLAKVRDLRVRLTKYVEQ